MVNAKRQEGSIKVKTSPYGCAIFVLKIRERFFLMY